MATKSIDEFINAVYDEASGGVKIAADVAVGDVAINVAGVESRLDQANSLLTQIKDRPSPEPTDVSGVESRLDTLVAKPDFQATDLTATNAALTALLAQVAPTFDFANARNLVMPAGQSGTVSPLPAGTYLLIVNMGDDGLAVCNLGMKLADGDRLHLKWPGGDFSVDNTSTEECSVSLVPFTI